MSYKAINSNETYQIDQNGKVIDSIMRSVEPDADEKGAYLNVGDGKVYVAEQVAKLHGKKAAEKYVERFNAKRKAIKQANTASSDEDQEPEEGKEVSPEEKVDACKVYFEENDDATYAEVKEALIEDGIKVNDQHVSQGKKAAGLKGE